MPSSAKEIGGGHQFRGAGLALAAATQSQGTPCVSVCLHLLPGLAVDPQGFAESPVFGYLTGLSLLIFFFFFASCYCDLSVL